MNVARQTRTMVRCQLVGRWVLAIGVLSVLVDFISITRLHAQYPEMLRLAGTTFSTMFILCGLGILNRVRWGYYLMIVALHFMPCCKHMRSFAKELRQDVYDQQVKSLFNRNWLLFSWGKPRR